MVNPQCSSLKNLLACGVQKGRYGLVQATANKPLTTPQHKGTRIEAGN